MRIVGRNRWAKESSNGNEEERRNGREEEFIRFVVARLREATHVIQTMIDIREMDTVTLKSPFY